MAKLPIVIGGNREGNPERIAVYAAFELGLPYGYTIVRCAGSEWGRMMHAVAAQRLQAPEKQRLLSEASTHYMQGEISIEDFENAEHQYSPDYRAAMLTIARLERQRSHGFLSWLRGHLGLPRD